MARRLLAPAARIPLDRLAEHWVAATVEATVPGHGALVGDLVLMNRVRRALGRMLASELMDPKLKQAAEKAAAEDRRALSSLIEVLLANHCKGRELLTEDGRILKRGRK